MYHFAVSNRDLLHALFNVYIGMEMWKDWATHLRTPTFYAHVQLFIHIHTSKPKSAQVRRQQLNLNLQVK